MFKIEIDHETIFGGYHDFSSCSSRFGQKNLLFFAGGECIHFCLDVVADHSPSLKAGCESHWITDRTRWCASSSCDRAAAD